MASELRAVGSVLPQPRLAVAARFQSLEDAIGWTFAQGGNVADIVVQDELTHDVVIRTASAAFLVFDTTWLGAINAVSVWDHQPTADELLDDRLARGWIATPTGTVDGPVILGHAACRVMG